MYITPKYMHSINRSDNYDPRHTFPDRSVLSIHYKRSLCRTGS